jgi:hypothetical protein
MCVLKPPVLKMAAVVAEAALFQILQEVVDEDVLTSTASLKTGHFLTAASEW